MLNITPEQRQRLHDIIEAIETTNYGRRWPHEYSKFFRVWGFFNSIYDTLYTDAQEWQRVSRFALDDSFRYIWDVLSQKSEVQELARQPCIGNGRNRYKPSLHVQISFQTLRNYFRIDVQEVCQSSRCQLRQQKNFQICLVRNWENSPKQLLRPEDAQFDPFGATLLIIYQIRNNLFHGSKHEVSGPDRERNELLVRLGYHITQSLLEEVKKLIP